jgi:hydrogenase maturation protease
MPYQLMSNEKKLPGPYPKVIILGVGNILLKDEGVGIRVIERLRRDYLFPDNVTLIEGATDGIDLLSVIRHAEYIIIVDAITSGQAPGQILKFSPEKLSARNNTPHSLHQLGLHEVLQMAKTLDGKLPTITILGIVPEDVSGYGLELTELMRSRIPLVLELILNELAKLKIEAKKLPAL